MTSSDPVYRIGIDARFFGKETGGIGRYTRELITHLAAIDSHNQYTVFLKPEHIAEWTLQQANFRPLVVEADYYSPSEQTTFLRLLQKQKLDLVHFLNFNHPLLYRRPFVTTLHDFTVYFNPVGRTQKSQLRRAAFIQIFKHSLKAAKRVISVSEHSAKDAEKVFAISQTKIDIVYEGGPEMGELPFGSKAIVQDYLNSRQPYFLFVSQWRPHKGIITLVTAFNEFKQKTGLPHQLVLVGKQTVSEALVKEALEKSPYLSDILTPGFVPEELLPSLYHFSTAHILPSEYEGFGLTILEAFACQTPVIVADNSSLPEVGGKAALYFPTGDALALSKQLETVATDGELRQSLIEKGEQQRKRFSWQRTAQQTLAVYLHVLENPKKKK